MEPLWSKQDIGGWGLGSLLPTSQHPAVAPEGVLGHTLREPEINEIFELPSIQRQPVGA